jgi:hypothetical protein
VLLIDIYSGHYNTAKIECLFVSFYCYFKMFLSQVQYLDVCGHKHSIIKAFMANCTISVLFLSQDSFSVKSRQQITLDCLLYIFLAVSWVHINHFLFYTPRLIM